MMKTVGLIVEYNPFHNGHLFHFEQSMLASSADAAVAVMSGGFLQRGEPALVNKWARTEMALRAGIDLVIELPVLYSTQPAEWFAYGAVSLLDATGVVDTLCFGSESGDIRWMAELADLLKYEPDSFKQSLHSYLKQGLSYPSAYSKAAAKLMRDERNTAATMNQPNNILGLNYLLSLQKIESRVVPLTITRQKAGYNQTDITDHQIASATAIRHALFRDQNLDFIRSYVPATTYQILEKEFTEGRGPISWDDFIRPLAHLVLSQPAEEIRRYYEIGEGLEHRIVQSLKESWQSGEPAGFNRIAERIQTRRYTKTRVQRSLLRILLSHDSQRMNQTILAQGPSYIRVLGFSRKGRQLLQKMKKTARLPIITKVTRDHTAMLEMDLQATACYALAYRTADLRQINRDFYEPPIMY